MAKFLAVAELAEEMAGTASRLKKRAAIAAAVSQVNAEGGGDEGLFCAYLAGLPFAESDGRKLNAGGALLTRAVLAVSGATGDELTIAYRRHGDLGAAAHDLMVEHNRTGEGSSLREVEEAFAAMAGAKTTAIRAAKVEALLRKASPLEAKYLLKLMLGDMRIGVKQSLVEEAIGVAASADVAAVRHAVMLEADLADAAVRAFAGTLAEARMRLFHPLGFMLASPVETPEEAIERFTAKPPKPAPVKKPKRKRKGAEPELDEAMLEAEANDIEAAMLDAADDTEAAPPMFENANPSASSGQAMGNPELSPESGVQAFLEDKYDGMRAQIHCGDASQPGRVAIYSRNREDITESYPELVEAFAQVGDQATGLIFDGEILGWDFSSNQALPFAILGGRIGRKRVGNEWRVKVPVIFMAFDLMFADNTLQLARPLRQRRARLEELVSTFANQTQSPLLFEEREPQRTLFSEPAHHEDAVMNGAQVFPPTTDRAPSIAPFAMGGLATTGLPRLMISPARLVESADEIDRAYADARARANEGVMLKAAGSHYQPGRRGLAWVKLKRELATLDVVITGAEYGSGRRSQFLSDYTFAVRDAAGELKNVGKAYSGVTDLEITELTEFLKAHTLEDFGHFRTVEPLIVLEVAFNNIMRSDRHASGFALRFPRILCIRRDKPLDEIDTVARVEAVYESQVDKPAAISEAENS